MKKRMGKNCRFTLIEIMIVLTVVLILVSMGILLAPLVTRQASESKTKALMGMIDSALQEYKNYRGIYPVPTQMIDSKLGTQYSPLFILGDKKLEPDEAQFESKDDKDKVSLLKFFDFEQIKAQTVFMNDPGTKKGIGHCVTDGFGVPFLYMAPGYRMAGGYDLVSLGANGMPGDAKVKEVPQKIRDRIATGRLSVEDKTETSYAVLLGEGDDLANFKQK